MTVSPQPTDASEGVSVVVIAYNDAELVGDAITSALAQGPAVAEVIAVDDASTDGTGAVLDGLARQEQRLRVIHRQDNSGGCGTPRNDGIAAAIAPYVMFLDSDDVLPPGAVGALLAAAEEHGAEVTVGAAVRRELPEGREVRWQPGLYRQAAVHEGAEQHPELLRDTLCVNKLYRRDFLMANQLRFPEGKFVYEDFAFTAGVLAVASRIAVIPDVVYVWNVRRAARQVSISLARKGIANWESRIAAHAKAVEAFAKADRKTLAAACRTKFLDYDLGMYLRELPSRDAGYQRDWWRLTRAYLAGFEAGERAAASAPARWAAAVILACEAPRDLDRLAQLSAAHPRLLPPYTGPAAAPVWSDDLPEAALDGIGALTTAELPLTADGTVHTGRRTTLELRVHELYGRIEAAGGVCSAAVDFVPRDGVEAGATVPVALSRTADAQGWCGRAEVPLEQLAARGGRSTGIWEAQARLGFADGSQAVVALRAMEGSLGRRLARGGRYGVLLVRLHRTSSGSLSVRLASGPHALAGIVRRRLRKSFRPPR
ncbi:glycosyltransferase family 2 protein [Streptomyces sp. PR69]|uniref:glycosyltransferase family 2 protein n=1 Tax=Streptomyces sp. PR69 TaxID=2984950 RepID=UPI0022647E5D|nr:glycosyltransferase family 2 protein [Streptomyces sp. PR69]